MAMHLEAARTDEILWELIGRRHVDWQDVSTAGGVDRLEAEHRELIELRVQDGPVIVVGQPL